MASRRWREARALRQVEQEPDTSIMIEHSITKYKAKEPSYGGNFRENYSQGNNYSSGPPQPSSRSFWPKEKYNTYLKSLEEKGFKIGTRVITKYGIAGMIDHYTDCPDGGMTFYGTEVPSIMHIRRDIGESNLLYNELELKLEGAA